MEEAASEARRLRPREAKAATTTAARRQSLTSEAEASMKEAASETRRARPREATVPRRDSAAKATKPAPTRSPPPPASSSQREDLSRLSSLRIVLGMNEEVDYPIGSAKRLNQEVEKLSHIKAKRFNQRKKMALKMVTYWSVLSTPLGERSDMLFLIHFADANSSDEITEDNALSINFIKTVENKLRKLKEQMVQLIRKKEAKLKQIYESSHMVMDDFGVNDTGKSHLCAALIKLKSLTSAAKHQASLRGDIVTRVEFIQTALQEITWYLNSCASMEEERVIRTRILLKAFPQKLQYLEDKIDMWNREGRRAFEFDGIGIDGMVKAMKENYDCLVGNDSPVRTEPPSASPSSSPQTASDSHYSSDDSPSESEYESSEQSDSNDSDYHPSEIFG